MLFLVGGRRFTRAELLVASNANIGGPATACALCDARGWAELTTPALLVGNLGYALATFLALGMHRGFASACAPFRAAALAAAAGR